MSTQGQPPKGGPGSRPAPLNGSDIFGTQQVSGTFVSGSSSAAPSPGEGARKVIMGFKMVPQPVDPTTLPTRSRVINFYSKYNSEKLSQVDEILEKYKGHEDAVISGLIAKYGPEPPALVPTKTPVWGLAPVSSQAPSSHGGGNLTRVQSTGTASTSPTPVSPGKRKMMKKRPTSLASTVNALPLGATTTAMLEGSSGTYNRSPLAAGLGVGGGDSPSPPHKLPPSFRKAPGKKPISRSGSLATIDRKASSSPTKAGAPLSTSSGGGARRKLLSEFKLKSSSSDTDSSASDFVERSPQTSVVSASRSFGLDSASVRYTNEGGGGPSKTSENNKTFHPPLPDTPTTNSASPQDTSISFVTTSAKHNSSKSFAPEEITVEDRFAAHIKALAGKRGSSSSSSSSSSTIDKGPPPVSSKTHALAARRRSSATSNNIHNNNEDAPSITTDSTQIRSIVKRRGSKTPSITSQSSLRATDATAQPKASIVSRASSTGRPTSEYPSSMKTAAYDSRAREGDITHKPPSSSRADTTVNVMSDTDAYDAPPSGYIHNNNNNKPSGSAVSSSADGNMNRTHRSPPRTPAAGPSVPMLNFKDNNISSAAAVSESEKQSSQLNHLRQRTPDRSQRSGNASMKPTVTTSNRYGIPNSPTKGPTPAPLHAYRRPSPVKRHPQSSHFSASPEPNAPAQHRSSRPASTGHRQQRSSTPEGGAMTTIKTASGSIITVIDRRSFTPNTRAPFGGTSVNKSGGKPIASRPGSMGPPYQSPSRHGTPTSTRFRDSSPSNMSIKEIAAREHRSIVKLDVLGRGSATSGGDGIVASTFVIKDKDRPSAWAREPLRKDFVAKMQDKYGEGSLAFDASKVRRATTSEIEVDGGVDPATGLRTTNIYRSDRVYQVLREVPVGPDAVKRQEDAILRLARPRPLFVARDAIID